MNHFIHGKDDQQIWEVFVGASTHRKLIVDQNPENAKERGFTFHPLDKNLMMSIEVFNCMFPDKSNF